MFCEKNFKIGVFKASKIQFLFSHLCRQRSATVTTVVQTDSALHWREDKNWILLALKTPILKIFRSEGSHELTLSLTHSLTQSLSKGHF